jgi:hypothetical protein
MYAPLDLRFVMALLYINAGNMRKIGFEKKLNGANSNCKCFIETHQVL